MPVQGVPIRCFKVYLNVLVCVCVCVCVCDLKDKDKIDKKVLKCPDLS